MGDKTPAFLLTALETATAHRRNTAAAASTARDAEHDLIREILRTSPKVTAKRVQAVTGYSREHVRRIRKGRTSGVAARPARQDTPNTPAAPEKSSC